MPTTKIFLAGAADFLGNDETDGLVQFITPADHGKQRVILYGIYYFQPIPPAAGTQAFCLLLEVPPINPTDAILVRYWDAANLLTNWDYPCKRALPIGAGGDPFAVRFVTTTKSVDATLYVDWDIEPIGSWA